MFYTKRTHIVVLIYSLIIFEALQNLKRQRFFKKEVSINLKV